METFKSSSSIAGMEVVVVVVVGVDREAKVSSRTSSSHGSLCHDP